MFLPDAYFKRAPVEVYMVCIGAGRKPLEYIGEWPRRGQVYSCRIWEDCHGERYVTVVGLIAPQMFKYWRWHFIARVWLN